MPDRSSAGATAAALPGRLARAWRTFGPDQRMAALAAFGLLVTMFLPWYEKNTIVGQGASARFASDSVSAFGVVSFVEAAVFLVSAGVLVLLFLRAEQRAFHLPGGDGTVIFAAGLWAALLIFFRVFDRPDVAGNGSTVGIQWGFFLAFLAAGALAYSGQRVRMAHRPEPTRAQDATAKEEPTAVTHVVPRRPAATAATRRRPRARAAATPVDPEGQIRGQLSFEHDEADDAPPPRDPRDA